ncbi:MAG: DUF3048 domain-containing protein [Paenibacillaceae bacterium]
MLKRTKLVSEKKKNRRRLAGISVVILIAIVIIVILSNSRNEEELVLVNADTPNATQEVIGENLNEDIPVEPPKPFRYPLTGMGSDVDVKSRPMMFMVENQSKARPQDGLHLADIVYEILAEGEITRFIAVYQSQEAPVIGPVRSIRPYFVQIGYGLDALVVHAGWSQDAMNMIVAKKVAHFDEVYGDGAYYWRDKIRKAPHNLYTSTELIRKGALKKKFREEWTGPSLTFYSDKETPVITGQPAATVTIPYIQGYTVGYRYDAMNQRYNRIMAGKLHKDKTTGTQLTAENIIIAFSKHIILDNAGRRKVDVIGPGEGYIIQRGQLRNITWENKDGIIRSYIDGREVELLPGQTWIHVVPIGSQVEYQ